MKQTQRSFNSTLRRSRKPIKQRPKTRVRNQKWAEFCRYWIDRTIEEFGHIICWWCGEPGTVDEPDDFNAIWGHHIDGDRNNVVSSNCAILHHRCQTEVHTNHVNMHEIRTREQWLQQLKKKIDTPK